MLGGTFHSSVFVFKNYKSFFIPSYENFRFVGHILLVQQNKKYIGVRTFVLTIPQSYKVRYLQPVIHQPSFSSSTHLQGALDSSQPHNLQRTHPTMKFTTLATLFCAAATGSAIAINLPPGTEKPLPPIQANRDECKNKTNGDPCKWHSAPGRPQLGKDGKGLDGKCIQVTLPNKKPEPITCVSFALWKRIDEELD